MLRTSHSWYYGGYKPNNDAPVLLTKFVEFLYGMASDDDGISKLRQILTALANQPSVTASIWASLLVAGAQHPSLFGHELVPLACAAPIMVSSDTRYQLGAFISAAYSHLSEDDQEVIERSILALSGE